MEKEVLLRLEVKALSAELSLAKARIVILKSNNANHRQTLAGIRDMKVSDPDRMKLWAADALSGYVEPVESTIFRLHSQLVDALEISSSEAEKRLRRIGNIVLDIPGLNIDNYNKGEVKALNDGMNKIHAILEGE